MAKEETESSKQVGSARKNFCNGLMRESVAQNAPKTKPPESPEESRIFCEFSEGRKQIVDLLSLSGTELMKAVPPTTPHFTVAPVSAESPELESVIREISEIYRGHYYDRDAFLVLAERDRRSPEEVHRAIEAVTSGGELNVISREEWERRIKEERVLVMKNTGGEIVGVISYYLSSDSDESKNIGDELKEIKFHEKGWPWMEHVIRDNYSHILAARDIFFKSDITHQGLFREIIKQMLRYEEGLPEKNRVIHPNELEKWSIWYYVNWFMSIFREGEDDKPALEALQNVASSIAGAKLLGTEIGFTIPRMPSPVPQIVKNGDGQNDVEVPLLSQDGKPVMTRRGYVHFAIPMIKFQAEEK
ncbi:MAG: hypothetical protein Q8O95_01680 [bacterium]|nr:hypothetical protein [bacterium]